MWNENKYNEYVSNFIFLKKKHLIVRDEYNFVKILKGNEEENKKYFNKCLV